MSQPKAAIEANTQGTVVVRFYVDKEGIIQEAKLLRDIGNGCGEESLRIVNMMNEMSERWTPGKQSGKAVNVYFNLPIKYRLQGPAKKENLQLDFRLVLDAFSISPNPNNGVFTVSFEAPAVATNIQIKDIFGKTIRSKALPDFNGKTSIDFDTSELAAGNYVVAITQGDKIFAETFVKQ